MKTELVSGNVVNVDPNDFPSRSPRGKPGTLADKYPFKTIEVGQAIKFLDDDPTQYREANSVRTMASKYGRLSGKRFSFRASIIEGDEPTFSLLIRTQ